MAEIRLVNLDPAMAPELARIELACFPLANPDDLLGEDDILAYADIFPEGYFVAMDGDRPVGMGAGIFLDFDFDNPQHTIAGITGEHQCGNHDPDGEWYYGTDMTVLPSHRGRGIGRMLYEARKDLVRRHGKRGIVAGGSLPGFFDHKQSMTIDDYVSKVVSGELRDPTLTFQLSNGFEVRGLLENYIEDEADDGWAALIVWEAET
ncbi:MAG: GNAT family N-acetyltransferase [Acidimicrobiia bacterium]|nr:GNAT family N-acetyltransferase [Acidimicrobiia bacterium]MDH3462390.1 GNAT family N-acetyltransferase [Acidimicrobiia bacterium]